MIEKMKFLSISGPKEDIDRVVETYLSRYPIHLENALSELSKVRDLTPYIQVNPYREWISRAEGYLSQLPPAPLPEQNLPRTGEAIAILRKTEEIIREKEEELAQKKALREEKEELLRQITPYRTIPIDVSELLRFRFIKYRFGRIPKPYIQKFEQFIEDRNDILFIRCLAEEDYIWGVYFVTREQADRVDAVLASLHFERQFLPDSYEGTYVQAFERLKRECRRMEVEIEQISEEISRVVADRGEDIRRALARLQSMNMNFDVRKLAACTQTKHRHTYYILCGWMTESDAAAFQEAIAADENVSCVVEDPGSELFSEPPTRLKNPGIIKPFEMYVRMYGMPNYRELDPTLFVALTYAFLFGAMFGDLGQGLCLLIGGFALYKWKGIALAGIIAAAGFFSSLFGILFGSVFGFENIIPALWLRPMEAIMQVPAIGSLNTVFVAAILFGMFLILSTMVLHIINAVRLHRPGEEWLDANGVAGLVFYGTLTVSVLLFVTGHRLPAGIILGILLGGPLAALALKEPLTNQIEKRRPLLEGSVGMYIAETFFELFETLLSFFSNTLSFIRVGAFAISHAAMMQVVLMLAGAENGGGVNWAVVILGNLFVAGMEGMIVGIQVLRLEYYEMFGRFYRGDGREFRPFGKKR